jgi:hypothetical protein
MAKGVKTGGRVKGSINKATAISKAITAELIEEAKQAGKTPLAFMLDAMNDVGLEMPERLRAANNAAPYIHPKLATTEVKHSGAIEFKSITRRIVKHPID